MPQQLGDMAATLDAYRTCELVTLGKDGTPSAWPTSGISLANGTFLLTTSLGYPQKAFNIRRDPRVALLFSDPTASGLENPAQICVRGTAHVSDTIHTDPSGDLAVFWTRLFERQPTCRKYLDWPATTLTDFYFMRLLITVTPDEITTRPLPAGAPASVAGDLPEGPAKDLIGAQIVADYPTVVLAAHDADGAPTAVRTTAAATTDGYRLEVPAGLSLAPGRATLLAHRHDDQLWSLHNANIQGDLTNDTDGWLLRPTRLIEPGGRHKPRFSDSLTTVRACRTATRRYLTKRSLGRPAVPWAAYRALRKAAIAELAGASIND